MISEYSFFDSVRNTAYPYIKKEMKSKVPTFLPHLLSFSGSNLSTIIYKCRYRSLCSINYPISILHTMFISYT